MTGIEAAREVFADLDVAYETPYGDVVHALSLLLRDHEELLAKYDALEAKHDALRAAHLFNATFTVSAVGGTMLKQ
jgi:hypothetical protein